MAVSGRTPGVLLLVGIATALTGLSAWRGRALFGSGSGPGLVPPEEPAEQEAEAPEEVARLQELRSQLKGCPDSPLGMLGATGGLRRARRLGDSTLFCWMMVTPHLQELMLLRVQLCVMASIFGCDEHLIISNTSIRALMADVPGSSIIKETIMPGPMSTDYGGFWHTSLNTDLFLSAWSLIWDMNLHRIMDFSVKVDADSAFRPDLLPALLAKHTEEDRSSAMWLESCPWCEVKLIGPIEVFSKKGIERIAENKYLCHNSVAHHNISEDTFFERCGFFLGMTGVPPRAKLLWPGWNTENVDLQYCRDGWSCVHPLKNHEMLLKCYEAHYSTPFEDGV